MRYLLLALAVVVALPGTYSFRPRPTPPYVPPERSLIPVYLRPIPSSVREAQVLMCRPAGLGLTWPRTDLVWDGPDLLFTTPEGRYQGYLQRLPSPGSDHNS